MNQFFIDCFLLTTKARFSVTNALAVPGKDVSKDFQVRRCCALLDQAQVSAYVPAHPTKAHWR